MCESEAALRHDTFQTITGNKIYFYFNQIIKVKLMVHVRTKETKILNMLGQSRSANFIELFLKEQGVYLAEFVATPKIELFLNYLKKLFICRSLPKKYVIHKQRKIINYIHNHVIYLPRDFQLMADVLNIPNRCTFWF